MSGIFDKHSFCHVYHKSYYAVTYLVSYVMFITDPQDNATVLFYFSILKFLIAQQFEAFLLLI